MNDNAENQLPHYNPFAITGETLSLRRNRWIELRPEVQKFALAMENRMRAEAWKPDWKEEHARSLFTAMMNQTLKLEALLLTSPLGAAIIDTQAILVTAAQIAVDAMKVASVSGGFNLFEGEPHITKIEALGPLYVKDAYDQYMSDSRAHGDEDYAAFSSALATLLDATDIGMRVREMMLRMQVTPIEAIRLQSYAEFIADWARSTGSQTSTIEFDDYVMTIEKKATKKA